jgi:hypothetical protein
LIDFVEKKSFLFDDVGLVAVSSVIKDYFVGGKWEFGVVPR